MTGPITSILPPALRYEMYHDDDPEFKVVITKMLKLGYRVSIVKVQRDYQQSQRIGNTKPQ